MLIPNDALIYYPQLWSLPAVGVIILGVMMAGAGVYLRRENVALATTLFIVGFIMAGIAIFFVDKRRMQLFARVKRQAPHACTAEEIKAVKKYANSWDPRAREQVRLAGGKQAYIDAMLDGERGICSLRGKW
jgi:hypothetical protein